MSNALPSGPARGASRPGDGGQRSGDGSQRSSRGGRPPGGGGQRPGSGSPGDRPGFELPLRLLAGFRVLIDDLHAELRQQGHPELRPLHGFVLQAIGRYGTTAADLGRHLGVSKQAAGKTIDNLQQLGYVIRVPDTVDQRQKIVVLTDYGVDALQRSAAIFEQLRAGWADALGAERLQALEDDLETVTGDVAFQLDTPGWFGAG